jgi:phosphoribosylaminoimidazolecarboxamide formyltransferase / IMP cyclohydrolase
MKRAALLSVSDRTGLEDLAKVLLDCGYELLATSGTLKFLSSVGIKTRSIEEYTGQQEILDGRVKTLHPKIHAGLLAKRSNPSHMSELEKEGILPIDIAVINLYPFLQNVTGDAANNPEKMVELVDVGGPTMIRAAAKNFATVLPLIDPKDYSEVCDLLRKDKGQENPASGIGLDFRRKLAVKVFSWVSNYDLEIAKYFSTVQVAHEALQPGVTSSPNITGVVLTKEQELRYGENPHQKAAMYRAMGTCNPWKQHQGKELSYNNLLDADAAFRLIKTFVDDKPSVAILKHLNPCGVAVANSLFEAVKLAKLGDPRSHFGGVLAFNGKVDATTANSVTDDFAEIVIAPSYEQGALDAFSKKKNLRVLEVDLKAELKQDIRSVHGAFLIQEADIGASKVSEAELVTSRKPSSSELQDLELAWKICAHVKSNAITIAKNGMLLASGAGQMSRIDSLEVALMKCRTHGHDTRGAVAASDAFFPFSDSVELLAAQGISAIIAPSGSIKDKEVIAKANELGISLLFARDRHFKH